MKFIGITGGVGAGKSAVLDYLATKPGVRVMLADEIAHELMEPGTDCYEQIIQAFPEHDIYKEDGLFDRINWQGDLFRREQACQDERDRTSGSESICDSRSEKRETGRNACTACFGSGTFN